MNGSTYLVFKNIVLKDNVPTPYPRENLWICAQCPGDQGKKGIHSLQGGVIDSCKLLSILRPLLGSSGRVERALHH